MITKSEIPPEQELRPTDAPVLIAGLIAARRTGDELLESICDRNLRRLGIGVRFLSTFDPEVEGGK
jgi:hypothetical protein